MAGCYYEEVQSFKENRWTCVLLLTIILGVLIPLVYGLYWQVLQGERWGDKPMSDDGLIILSVFLLFVCALMSWLFLSIKLEITVDASGVSYKFFPQEPKWVKISRREIADFKIEKRTLLNAMGHRKDFSKNIKSMNINGCVLMSLELKNGTKVKLGSRNPEGLAWAMKKLFSSHDIN